MIQDFDSNLLTGSLSRKYIMEVRSFSSAKTSDMKYHIILTKRDFDSGIYILHVGTNDLTLDNTLKEITKHVVNIATSLEIENNTVVIWNIVPHGHSKKEKTEEVNKLLVDIFEQKEIPLIDHSNINTKKHLNKSRLDLNAQSMANLFLLEI